MFINGEKKRLSSFFTVKNIADKAQFSGKKNASQYSWCWLDTPGGQILDAPLLWKDLFKGGQKNIIPIHKFQKATSVIIN